jgi:anoctamin-1
MGHELTLVQQYCIVGLCFLPIFWLIGAGAALFWVIGASFFLIMTHALFYDIQAVLEPEDEFELTMEQVV